jgi:hypothetical protein
MLHLCCVATEAAFVGYVVCCGSLNLHKRAVCDSLDVRGNVPKPMALDAAAWQKLPRSTVTATNGRSHQCDLRGSSAARHSYCRRPSTGRAVARQGCSHVREGSRIRRLRCGDRYDIPALTLTKRCGCGLRSDVTRLLPKRMYEARTQMKAMSFDMRQAKRVSTFRMKSRED